MLHAGGSSNTSAAGVTGAHTAPTPAASWRARGAPTFFIAALVLILAGAALRQLALFNHDEPPLAALARDAQQAGGALLRDEAGAWQVLSRHHDAGERLWKSGWLALNGQLDHRLSSVTTIALQCGALAMLLLALGHSLRTRWLVLIGLGVMAALFAPTLTGVWPPAGSAGMSGALLLSLLHVIVMLRARPNSAGWWLGILVGLANVGWATSGLASAAAVTLWGARAGRRPLVVANASLLAAGLALAFIRARASTAEALSTIWPFTHFAPAIILWVPAVACLWRWMRSAHPTNPQRATMTLLAFWAALQASALALTAVDGSAVGEYLLAVLAINAACIVVFWPETATRTASKWVLSGIWAIVVADALIHARAALTDDHAGATAMLNRPELRSVLPTSLRAPIQLGSATTVDSGAFKPGHAPDLSGRGGLPHVGTWALEGGARTGEFVSGPLRSEFPFVQFRVAGTLRPPATSLVLRTADGKEIVPLDAAFTATERWKRVNFATPNGNFHVVARDSSATDWFAFTAPIEIGGLSRVAGKIPTTWPFVLGCGLLLAATAVITRPRDAVSAPATAETDATSAWRVAPWLALFAYLLFFSHHVDVTAGPNDSGGYLNSAKLLVAGTLSAAPRIPAGIALDRDPTLYMPITFHANGDRVVPEYPVGFPLQIWGLAQILPFERAVYVLMLLQLALGVWFTERLARAFGLGAGWAWLAGGIVGLSPVYLFQALQPQSDGPALVWVTAAVYWAWTSREKPWRAILAGLATALAVLLRPSNALCVFPVLVCFVGQGGLRRMITWGLAGLPAGLWLLWYQHTLYGSWHTTGYGDISTGFGLQFLKPTLQSYLIWLPEMFTPLVCLALAAPFLRSVPAHARAVLVTWAGVFVAFYSVYWCTWDNWYNMRFVLPAAPAMLVLALLVARELLRWLDARSSRIARWARNPLVGLAAAGLLLGFLGKRSADRDVLYWLHNNHEHAFAARWVRDHLPANAVIFAKHATGSLMHYTELPFIRSDHDKVRESPALFDQIERAGRPIYAVNYHWETAGYQWGRGRGSGYPDLPGSWERVALMWDDDVMVWKRRPSAATRP
jgi:hypothetical protein